MIAQASAADAPALEAFLARNFATTMFLRGNLRDFGIGNTTAPYAMRYFMQRNGAEITGVGAVANNGTLMGHAQHDLGPIAAHMRAALGPIMVPAVLGAQAHVDTLVNAFGLQDRPTRMQEQEPLFALELAQLCLPETNTTLRAPDPATRPLLESWTYAYELEVLGATPGAKTCDMAIQSVARQIDTDRLRVLFDHGQAVAKTAFTAVLPDCVQIGGVYTPPDLRGRGYAKSAVAQHLAEVRANGVAKAVLFSASPSASKVYRAIGFRQVGTYAITLFA